MSSDGGTAPRLRQLVHGRQIACRCYRRDDGRWEVDSTLFDVKTHDLRLPDGSVAAAGEPYRTLTLSVLLDDRLRILDARVAGTTPASRERAEAACQAVIGWQVGTGFGAETKDFFGRAADCPRLTEQFAAIVATAREAIPPERPAVARRNAED